MLRRTSSLLAVVALAGVAALVPTTASAADPVNVQYASLAGVTFSSASAATVPLTYTCWTTDDVAGTRPLHVRVAEGPATAEGDVSLSCDHTQHDVVVAVENANPNLPFENGTASVFLTIGSDAQQAYDDVAVTGVPELPKDADLAVQDGVVRFSSATEATVVVSYTCGTTASARDDDLHVTIYQPRATASQADASNPGIVPVVCDGSARSTGTIALAVGQGTFVNGSGSPNAEAWLNLDGESAIATQDVEVVGVPEVDHRAEVVITVNAGPEPATKGKKITVKGTIRRDGKPYKKKAVALEFRRDGGTYVRVKTVRSSSKGALSTRVTATRSGSCRWTSSATGSTRAGASGGDFVEVKPKPKPKPKPKAYANCTALRKVYPHGVGKKGARDRTSGTPVTTFTVDSTTYSKNTKSDRDHDGIACEQA